MFRFGFGLMSDPLKKVALILLKSLTQHRLWMISLTVAVVPIIA